MAMFFASAISATTVTRTPTGQQEIQKPNSAISFPQNEQAAFSNIKLGDIVWRETGRSYVRTADRRAEPEETISKKLCKSNPLRSSRDQSLVTFACYIPIFGKISEVEVVTQRINDQEYTIGQINFQTFEATQQNIQVFDGLMHSRYGDPVTAGQKVRSREEECNAIDQFSPNRSTCIALTRSVFPGQEQEIRKLFKKNGVEAESVLIRANHGNEIRLTITTTEFASFINRVKASDAKPSPESMSKEKAF